MKHLKNQSGSLVIEIILAVIAVGAVCYIIYGQVTHKPAASVATTSPAAKTSPSNDPYASWKTYSNPKFKYTFKYPADWTVVSQDYDADNTTQIKDNTGKSRVGINSVYGRGCTISTPPARKATFMVGEMSVEGVEFACGTPSDEYDFYVDTTNKTDIEVQAFIGSHEAETRQILKSVTGFVKAYQK